MRWWQLYDFETFGFKGLCVDVFNILFEESEQCEAKRDTRDMSDQGRLKTIAAYPVSNALHSWIIVLWYLVNNHGGFFKTFGVLSSGFRSSLNKTKSSNVSRSGFRFWYFHLAFYNNVIASRFIFPRLSILQGRNSSHY